MLELFWKSKTKAKKNEKGFTLVELIVVVAILGILAVIGITRFAGLTDNARKKADTATAASIASAAQVYIAESEQSVTASEVTVEKLVSEALIDNPKDPQTNKGGKWKITYTPEGTGAGKHKLTVDDSTGTTWYPQAKESETPGPGGNG